VFSAEDCRLFSVEFRLRAVSHITLWLPVLTVTTKIAEHPAVYLQLIEKQWCLLFSPRFTEDSDTTSGSCGVFCNRAINLRWSFIRPWWTCDGLDSHPVQCIKPGPNESESHKKSPRVQTRTLVTPQTLMYSRRFLLTLNRSHRIWTSRELWRVFSRLAQTRELYESFAVSCYLYFLFSHLRGKWPTVSPLLPTLMANLSKQLSNSLSHASLSPMDGFQISCKHGSHEQLKKLLKPPFQFALQMNEATTLVTSFLSSHQMPAY